MSNHNGNNKITKSSNVKMKQFTNLAIGHAALTLHRRKSNMSTMS